MFCQIIAGTISAEIVWESDDVMAFLDSRPVFFGHTLVVPRIHVPTLVELSDDLLPAVFTAARTIAAAMVGDFGAGGTFVAMNNVVSQSVAHLHLHVVPRTKGDGLRGFFWPRTTYADGEAAAYGDRLREALSAPDVRKS